MTELAGLDQDAVPLASSADQLDGCTWKRNSSSSDSVVVSCGAGLAPISGGCYHNNGSVEITRSHPYENGGFNDRPQNDSAWFDAGGVNQGGAGWRCKADDADGQLTALAMCCGPSEGKLCLDWDSSGITVRPGEDDQFLAEVDAGTPVADAETRQLDDYGHDGDQWPARGIRLEVNGNEYFADEQGCVSLEPNTYASVDIYRWTRVGDFDLISLGDANDWSSDSPDPPKSGGDPVNPNHVFHQSFSFVPVTAGLETKLLLDPKRNACPSGSAPTTHDCGTSAGQALAVATESLFRTGVRDAPDDTQIYIYTRHGNGSKGGSYNGLFSVDNHDEDAVLRLTNFGAGNKNVISHELGHCVAASWVNEASNIDSSSAAIVAGCNEENWAGTLGSGHNLNSTEYQACAWYEGFAHFFSAASWNDTDVSNANGWLLSYSDCWVGNTPNSSACDPSTGQVQNPSGSNCLDQHPWVRLDGNGGNEYEACPAGTDKDLTTETAYGATVAGFHPFSQLAVELDWMRVYWDYRTDAAQSGETRPDMDQIFREMRWVADPLSVVWNRAVYYQVLYGIAVESGCSQARRFERIAERGDNEVARPLMSADTLEIFEDRFCGLIPTDTQWVSVEDTGCLGQAAQIWNQLDACGISLHL